MQADVHACRVQVPESVRVLRPGRPAHEAADGLHPALAGQMQGGAIDVGVQAKVVTGHRNGPPAREAFNLGPRGLRRSP